MRVLLWCALYEPSVGGEERYTARLAAGLRARGAVVEVVTGLLPGTLADDEIDGIRVTRLPFSFERGDLASLRTVRDGLRATLDRLQPDVVDVQTSGPSLAHLALHRRALGSTPLALTFHGAYPDTPPIRRAVTGAVEGTGALLASSAATAASVGALLEADLEISVAHPAVAPSSTPVRPRPVAPTIVGPGRLVPEKGWDLAIRAMPAILATVPDARLVLVGDGPERGALEALAASLLPAAAVQFAGAVDDDAFVAHLDAAAVVVVPSRHEEGFGMVAIEAAARGRPVVAAARGGLVEAVDDAQSGVLIAPDDPGAIAAAVVDVLTDAARAERLRQGALRHAARFSLDRQADATLDALERAIGR